VVRNFRLSDQRSSLPLDLLSTLMPLIQDDARSDNACEHDDSAQDDDGAGAFVHALPLVIRTLGRWVLRRFPALCTRTLLLGVRGDDDLRGLPFDGLRGPTVHSVDRHLATVGDVVRPSRTIPVPELVPVGWIGVPISGR